MLRNGSRDWVNREGATIRVTPREQHKENSDLRLLDRQHGANFQGVFGGTPCSVELRG